MPRPARSCLTALFLVGVTLPAWADDNEEPLPGNVLMTFAAMGDIPYSGDEEDDLEDQLEELPPSVELVLHVGDIQSDPGGDCDEEVYETVSDILKLSPRPVFIVPGDNEFNDCDNAEEALELWIESFVGLEDLWPLTFPVMRQPERPENVAFVTNGVLFVGLNLVGGLVHDDDEWEERHRQDLDWTLQQVGMNLETAHAVVLFAQAAPQDKHEDYFDDDLFDALSDFGKPVLYVHGDGHEWIDDQPFPPDNMWRVQVERGGDAPPVVVTVTDNPEQPFIYDRGGD
ncbi:MAG: metallophosphoesterase [Myxococcota bacterium]